MSALHDAASMRESDRRAIAAGVPGPLLMARAGSAAARVLRSRYPAARRVVCVCGAGNNGGDGFVVARVLASLGVDARCVVIASRPTAGDAAGAEADARTAGVPIVAGLAALHAALADADVVVDGLLGTGAGGAPRGDVAEAIAALEAAGRPVLALDVPSGVDASTGEVPGVAVSADVTVTFHAAKLGLVVMPGLVHAGAVVQVAIGLPADAVAPAPAVLAGADAVAALPRRPRTASKHDSGRVVVIGGSTGLTGAVTLAARAALRGGAGLVTACVPASLDVILETTLTEAMTRPCADDAGALLPSAADVIRPLAAAAGAIVLGPGCGRDPRTAALVRALCALPAPLVVDADGLHALGDAPELLRDREAPTVITPHAGEAARLLGRERSAIAARRLDAVRTLAARSGAVAVLKGPDTLVAAPDGRLAVRDGDEPAIATGGTGDVLAGLLGALLARSGDPFAAACAAVAAHLAAARLARAETPGRVLVAGDLVEALRLDA